MRGVAAEVIEGVTAPGARPPRHVLVVDDSRAQRRLLAMALAREGYRVTEASSGDEALALCRNAEFDIVLSDWVMPGMSGLDFCRAFRALPREGYGYFILLTSRSGTAEIASGLDCGADDFLAKPVSPDELGARLRAGERIIGMHDELVEKNHLLGTTLAALQRVHDALDRELLEARKLQQTLMRDRRCDYGEAAVALMIRSAGHVGGDLVGSFRIDEGRLAVYSVDVSGHGIASAMLTGRLSGYFSGSSPDQNLAFVQWPDGTRAVRSPAALAETFNRRMLEEIQVEQYFTLAYAELDLRSGRVRLVQAGHPHPLVLRARGGIERVGRRGLPVGLIPGATYEEDSFVLAPGDRLMLVSDGITECPSATGGDLGEEGLDRILARLARLESPALLEALEWELAAQAGTEQFPDDVSCLMLDYRGPGGAAGRLAGGA